ncbi:MAG TPA: endonuclease III [Planctomycetaceae bacterium]|jgi:endonuclease-3|nr:endonuclease III [Planctomycetaceae bacterium]
MAKLIKIKPRAAAQAASKQSPASKIARVGKRPGSPRNDAPAKSPAGKSSVADDLRTQVRQILKALAKTYPDATCALKHESADELLVATILSAQCTDERVNMVTPILFAKYPDVESLSVATQADVEEIIRSTGFFRAKAASLRGMAQGVVERFGGQIPRSLDDLVTLPGVGRKTANVVLGTVWGIASGVVVDTHVKRITALLGITKSTSPEQIERDLMQIIPQSEWVNFSHRLIHHGRRICIARRPKCLECTLLSCCRRVGLPPLK